MLEIETENTRSHSVENSLWKRLWICRKTDYGMIKLSKPYEMRIYFVWYELRYFSPILDRMYVVCKQ